MPIDLFGNETPYAREVAVGDDEEWIERFVAHMIKVGSAVANDEFRAELPTYARNVAPSYLADRKDYADPEEAAETDISYWESEE